MGAFAPACSVCELIVSRAPAGMRQPVPVPLRVDEVWQARYVLSVSDPDPKTEELSSTQREREELERKRAETAPDEDEAAQHARRADKARYLAEKLEERAESERRHED
jgi:hypothetical protein